ncbi:hypothetical protein [Nocardioides sp. AE5]|uniref:hypothetical protein n=1 Tax=Nocardioides sp. AE5 TaxID=2962573 RepID=UPI002880EC4B|nr:hypothetical protein [Nocardioides sp. AE5]MDT0203101.1 hypothetical protein [Nocardioides sp. AE5]
MTGGPLGVCEDRVERFGELGFESYADAVVLVGQDEDLLEEGLVEQAPDVLGCAEVGGLGVGGQVECQPEVALDDLPLLVGGVEFGLDAGECLADAVLLLAEEVDWDGSGVVGFHELAALAVQLFVLLLELDSSPLDLVACVAELGLHLCLDVVAEGGVELDA